MRSETLAPALISASTKAARILPGARPSAGERLIEKVLGRIRNGRLTVVFPDGRSVILGMDPDGIEATMIIRDRKLMKRLILAGSLGFAEGFVEQEWDSPDLPVLLDLLCSNMDHINSSTATHWIIALARKIGHRLNANSRSGSRRNIAFHYDLGNDFYSQWLDPTMTYSSALFEKADMSLKEAQQAKYRRIARLLNIQPGEHVLEIGCGWGGFAELAAREFGAHVTGVTLSREQHDYARARMERAGLADRVDIRFEDYRDVRGTFDHIASIEMFEAVGEEHWPTYFSTVRDRLKPGGRAALQIITIDPANFDYYRSNPDFIQSYIFPGGMLPTPDILKGEVKKAGLAHDAAFTFGQDYARTLRIWREDFLRAWPDVERIGFDDRFRRLWLYYLAYCEAGFRNDRIDVGHYLISRPVNKD